MSAARFKTCVTKTLVPTLTVVGALSGLPLLLEWHSTSPAQFLTYLALGLLTSGWKVALPGVEGTLSANFIFVILSMLELSPGESLVVGGASVLFQYAWKARSRLRLLNAAFNLGSIWIAIRASDSVLHSRALESWSFDLPLRLSPASFVSFAAYTLPVAMAISFTGS